MRGVPPEQQRLLLDELQTIETPSLVLVAEALDKLADLPRSIAIVCGGAGVGKSFAIAQALSDDYPLASAAVSFTGQSGRLDVYRTILDAFVGDVPPGELYNLRQQTRKLFRSRGALLVIKRAERLKRQLLEELVWMMDDYSSHLRLVIVVAPSVIDVIERFPALDNLVEREVKVEGLSDVDAAEWLPRCHGFYREVSPTVIKYVNKHFARGNLWAWKRFTRDAMDLCQQRGEPLSVQLANTVFAWQRSAKMMRAQEPQ
jgi:hypothetical protein